MYDELVKRLRELSGTDNISEFDESADAIEELQADKAALNGTVTNLLDQIKDIGKPRWIPMPEPPKEVLTGTDMRGGIRRDDAGNVIDWGITGQPGDVGKTEEE